MTELPNHCKSLLGDVRGEDVLEFGNKKNKTGIFRDWYLAQGARHYTSVDYNGLDGALKLDVTNDITSALPLVDFSLVTNFGFSEHVVSQEPFWRNALALTRINGRLVCACPAPGKRERHGFSYWHPYPKFYEEIAARSAFTLVRWWPGEFDLVCAELVREGPMLPAQIPLEYIWENPHWKGRKRPPPKTA